MIPSFPQGRIVDELGFMTPEFRNTFEQLLQYLQQVISQEGFAIPQQDASNVTTLQTEVEPGTILFNTATNALIVKLQDGTFHTITTS